MLDLAQYVNDLTGVANQLLQSMRTHQDISRGGRPLPDPQEIADLIHDLRKLLFPDYFFDQGLSCTNAVCILEQLGITYWRLAKALHNSRSSQCAHECMDSTRACEVMASSCKDAYTFMQALPEIRELLMEDVKAAFAGDPAALSYDEIILAYPGMYAIIVHRLAHQLQLQGYRLIARMMSEHAHSMTGIDIHPGATIGKGFFIDHGTGVVIGETTVIGDYVKLYQGVTLGALSFPKDENGQVIKGQKRHPTIGDHVTIYAGATVLGGDTVIGEGSVIGGNVWLTESVPPHSLVVNHPHVKKMQKQVTEKG